MKEVVCFLLARLGGNKNPTMEDVTRILDCVGIKADEEKLKVFFDNIKNLDIDKAIEQGMEKLVNIPSAGNEINSNNTNNNNNTKQINLDDNNSNNNDSDNEADEIDVPDIFGKNNDETSSDDSDESSEEEEESSEEEEESSN